MLKGIKQYYGKTHKTHGTYMTTIVENSIKQDKINLFRVIYNNASNDYSFSDEFFSDLFIQTFQKKYYPVEISEIEQYFTKRYDPRVLDIYDSLGEQKSSIKKEIFEDVDDFFVSQLKITYFPEELKEYLDVVQNEEKEYIEVDKLKLYKEFYNRVVIQNESVEELKSRFQRLEYVASEYEKENNKTKPLFDNTDIFVKN